MAKHFAICAKIAYILFVQPSAFEKNFGDCGKPWAFGGFIVIMHNEDDALKNVRGGGKKEH